MLRKSLLFLSERERLKDFLLRFPVFRHVAHRFVAGDTLDAALGAARELNVEGFRVTLDYLGESVTDRRTAKRATDAYLKSLEAIQAGSADSTISLKLTQIGLELDRETALGNLRRIVGRAGELGNFVRVDMEGSAHTEATLAIFRQVFPEHRNVGVVIQSYLRRSRSDVQRLVRLGAPVRLCKGAYDEPAEVAFQDKAEVDDNYVHLMRMLLDGGSPTAIATHDEAMIAATFEHMERRGLSNEAVEFQMLYGIRMDYQRRIADAGHPMRIYVPYGSEWYPYLMRRMAERPANLWFVIRALAGG